MSKFFVLLPSALLCGVVLMSLAQKHEIPPVPHGEVPIGTILVWWGRAVDLPEGYEVCDGTPISTLGAVLRGRKPDLRNRFVRGTEDHRSFVPMAFAGGGLERVENETAMVQLSISDHTFTLAANQLPNHNHIVPRMPHRIVTADTGNGMGPLVNNPPALAASIAHQHSIEILAAANDTVGESTSHVVPSPTSTTFTTARWPAAGDALVESHPATSTVSPTPLPVQQAVVLSHTVAPATITLNQRENRPPFLDMVFILRVK